MSAKKETLGSTVGIVVAVCLACSIVVSTAAVKLRPTQQFNAQLDKQTNILKAAALLDSAGGDISGTYKARIQERYVDLATGNFIENPWGEKAYDQRLAARDPEQSVKPDPNTAGLIRRANVASVYLVNNEGGDLETLILPVHGMGLWNQMYAFLALDVDGNTVKEMVYYEQAETAGLGGEIQNPEWLAKWPGKKLFNSSNDIAITVKKNAGENDAHAIDALSGATLTSNGVDNTMKFWLSDQGFGPFLAQQPWKS